MATIILTGGGTAGHVTLNIALIPLLKKSFENIIYIGSENSIEERLLLNFPEVQFFPIKTAKLRRSLDFRNLLIPFNLYKGEKQAKEILTKFSPNVIFSKGGFVSVPVILAGKKLNIPIVSHESDFSLGLANKITRKHAKVICTTFKETADTLPNGLFVGAVAKRQNISTEEKARIRQLYNLNSNLPICLVMGGSQGAITINSAVISCLNKILKTHQVLHITGHGKMNNIKKAGYHPVEFVENLQAIYPLCDIAITRGGSNSIFELLANNIPMLIIPLSKGSRGDQAENAIYFEKKGYAITLFEQELDSYNFTKKFNDLVKIAPIMRASNKYAVPNDSIDKILLQINRYSIKK